MDNHNKPDIPTNFLKSCLTLSLVAASLLAIFTEVRFFSILTTFGIISFVLYFLCLYGVEADENKKRKEFEDEIARERERIRRNELRKRARKFVISRDYPNLVVDTRTRATIPNHVMAVVFDRDEGKCTICESTKDLEFDHIVPHSKGGSDTSNNLRLLCATCNRSRGNRFV
jgi:hypothetical protein